MHYRQGGEGISPVLFFHQTPDSSRAWEPVWDLLSGRHRLIAPDTPGYGDSDPLPETPTMARYGSLLADLLGHLECGPAVVVGHHTGAGIGVELAVSHPELVLGLGAIGMPFWPGAAEERLTTLPPPAVIDPDGEHLLGHWRRIRKRAPDAPPDLVHRRVIDRLRAVDPAAAYQAVYRYPMEDRLPRVSCPVLILDGADDPLHESGVLASKLLRDCELDVIPGVGVSVVDLKPQEVAARIESFIEKRVLRRGQDSSVASWEER
jgi:pimeloyl-ACP methyl ester carboxylesterase